jgi:hypothetical protein
VVCVVGRIELPDGQVSVTLIAFQAGLVAVVVNQAAGGVAAEQGALWTLEDLDPLDVEYRECMRLGDGNVAFVQIHGIGRLNDVVEVVLGHATNGKLRVLSGEVSADMDTGCEPCNVETPFDVQRFHLLSGEGRNGDAHVLQKFFALLGGDRHFLQD